ncbi:hypothetical protein H8E88_13945 [candidate division KSB1 bacterium]|nr:hypothetical protein [candidate division KSB1 bacterium]MBL7093811.1 hypothetical protein [candidate division KSB1 bacterium]
MKKVILIFLILPLPALAQLSSYEINGYVKYLFSTTEFPLIRNNRLNDHLIHTRINTRCYPTESLTAALELRLREYYGGSVEKIPGFKDQITDQYDDPKLAVEFCNKKKSFGYGQVDRLFLDYTRGNLQATIGRQRVAWGTALVWNVIDLFNPLSILDYDYEERPGADALRLQYYTGVVSKLELVAKPGETKYKKTIAGLWSINAAGYDYFIIAGIRKNRKLFGGAWAGDIAGAGFRGEFIISDAPNKGAPTVNLVPHQYGESITDGDKPVASFVLSADYTFSNSFYIHAETVYNNNGKKKNAGIFWKQSQQADMLSPARWSIFQEFSYNITPLIRASIFGIFNPDDFSYIVMPSATWSVVTNLDLMLIAYYSDGDPLTEWGDAGNAFITRLKYSF